MAHQRSSRGRTGLLVAAAVVVSLAVAVTWIARTRSGRPDPASSSERNRIAVLPFENLGPPADEYFADGITEEIGGRLAAVSELAVISRTSTRQYKGSDKPVKQIAAELGVDYVLEGTVRWTRSGDTERVVITPRLIRVADDTYVWSEQYDRVIDDLFRTQSDIASQVIEELDLVLHASTRRRIESAPTANFEAYQAWLRGLEATRVADYSEAQLNLGVSMFQRAVELDPNFAQAWAELSNLHSRAYHLGLDRTAERLTRARIAAERAVALDPELPETRLAVAYYHYWGHKDYDRALAELDATREATRNDTRFLEARGYILRRQGNYAEAVRELERALELSPRDASLAIEAANTHLGLWQFEQAQHLYDRAISLAPDQTGPYTLKVRNRYLWDGDLEAAGAILDAMPPRPSVRATWFRAFHAFLERDYDAVVAQLDGHRDEVYQTHAQTVPLALVIAWAREKQGDDDGARRAYDEALTLLDREQEEQPDDFRVLMARALVHAGLGDRAEALRLGEQATELYPISKDAWAGPIVARNRLVLLTRVGAFDEALEQAAELLAHPNPGASPSLFRIDPRLDDLRALPGYQEIVDRAPVPAS